MSTTDDTDSYTTPSGHTYDEPRTVAAIRSRATTYAQGIVESWDEEELPPAPSWRMIGVLLLALNENTRIMQRLRAGWLPHKLSAGGWWWGRPRDGGFELWGQGMVPSMTVVEQMTDDEIAAWTSALHEHAPEREREP